MSGTLIVSLDFELYWGMTDRVSLDDYREHLLGARTAIPRLLELFEKHGVHATWATVGFLFADSRDEAMALAPSYEKWPTYDNRSLWNYALLDTVGENEEQAPCHFAPSLIQLIANTPYQEIGTHTYSHYYCREAGQTPAQFCADMQAAQRMAKAHGFEVLSVVLPRNQCEEEYTAVMRDLGFAAYRDEENDWIHEKVKFRPLMRLLRLVDIYLPLTGQGGYIPKVEQGIVNLVGSRMYKPIMKPLRILEGLKIRRIKKQMLHAAKHGLTFHLWWHPHNIGVMTDEHLSQLEEIFAYYDYLKDTYGMRSMNMCEVADRLK